MSVLESPSTPSRPSAVVSPGQPQATDRRSWAVLAIALIAQILVVLDISVVNTALPTIGRSLQLDGSRPAVARHRLPADVRRRTAARRTHRRPPPAPARVHDRARPVHVRVAGRGFAGSAGVLIAARATQGLGAALMTPAALSLIMTTYTGAQRARGLALWAAVGSMGVAAGVLFGGALTTWAGWQTIFWINVPFGIAAFVAAIVVLPKETSQHAGLSRLDLPGGITVVAGLGVLLLGIQGAAQHGWTSPRTLVAVRRGRRSAGRVRSRSRSASPARWSRRTPGRSRPWCPGPP